MALTEYLSDDLQPSEDALYRHHHCCKKIECCVQDKSKIRMLKAMLTHIKPGQVPGDFQNQAMEIEIRLRVNLYRNTD
jgi:hypothetical protein